MELKTPHIPLGISLDEGIEILGSFSSEIEEFEEENEVFYKISCRDWECGFYCKDNIVQSTWFNDPFGREDEMGINRKVTLYLTRYGRIEDWEDRMNNGWIQFFFNEESGVNLAYGLHKDVLRFNQTE
ncbi:hypothetical protein [Marinobacter sp.]|uniref:hypothetical protein n=1 Tax=Marinobacter sp. TaxID=50741 RepID=UPI003BACEA61